MIVEKGTQLCQTATGSSTGVTTAGMSNSPEINKYFQKYGPILKRTYPVPMWAIGLAALLILKKK